MVEIILKKENNNNNKAAKKKCRYHLTTCRPLCKCTGFKKDNYRACIPLIHSLQAIIYYLRLGKSSSDKLSSDKIMKNEISCNCNDRLVNDNVSLHLVFSLFF